MRKNKSALLPHRFLECTKLMVKIKHQAKAILYRHDSLLRLYSTLTKRKLTFAANDLDLLIAELIPSPGFYVELGANDGVAQSQTKYLEVYHGWHGVLIEPTPEIFKMLKMNRSKRNYFENSACVSFEFPNSKIPMLYSDLMTISLEGQNDIANRGLHAHEGIGHLLRGSENYEYSATATTLNQILTTSVAPRVIELLSLDVLEVCLKGFSHCVGTRIFRFPTDFLNFFRTHTNNRNICSPSSSTTGVLVLNIIKL